MITALGLVSNAEARGLFGSGKIVVKEGRLADALRQLSVRSGSNLLFAPDVVGNLRSRRVVGGLEVEPILARLLEDTGLGYRRVGDGTYIVFRLQVEQPTALPEVLVIGRKTQNADIRRTENDIQGYRVATSVDIRASHADNLDQFLRTRQPSNAQREGPSTDPSAQYAANRSEVNLHGLGANQTLVLVDGVRMPSTISQSYSLEIYQPDLNGLPLLAIDRIESLTGTAGGIYGPGATGGVVNVVLKRDYRGAEVSATFGMTGRGDGARRRVDARIGFTPDDGATDVMINVSRTESDGLRAGDRDYEARARRLLVVQGVVDQAPGVTWINGLLIQSVSGNPLRLSAALGGASLGSSFTYLPTGHSGIGDGSVLLANAGRVPDSLPPDGNGATRSLTSATTVTSLLLNVRHRFGNHVEAFADFIGFENEGRSTQGWPNWVLTVGRSRGGAVAITGFPFQEPVSISLPMSGFDATARNRLRTTRSALGVIFSLPAVWRAELTYSFGGTRNRIEQKGFAYNWNLGPALQLMQPGLGGEPAPNPFGPWDQFLTTLRAYTIPQDLQFERKLRMRDLNVRLGGPILRREAGDVALSLQAERREEKAKVTPWYTNGAPDIPPASDPSFSVTVSSLYGELRAPIVSRGSDWAPLRGLELQLAARHDNIQADIPGLQFSVEGPMDRTRYDRGATVYTAGLRAFPLNALMVRASVATGVLPPTPQQMAQGRYTYGLPATGVSSYADPARGGDLVGAEKPATILTGGSDALLPEKARTLAMGLVINPDGVRGPRVSLDYTHTEKRREVDHFNNRGTGYFLDNETLYPGRITRDPLTPADIAAGYSAGVITQIDATYMNIAKTTVDAIDLQIDQGFRLGPNDRLRTYGSVTWTPRLVRRDGPDRPVRHYVGTDEGPLRWRGAAGATWDHDDLTIGVDAQYYHAYRATGTMAFALAKTAPTGVRIPSQVYLDANMTYRLSLDDWQGRPRDVEIRFGVQNLLDHDPPTVTNAALSYSYYGDPRGRRFELSATARF